MLSNLSRFDFLCASGYVAHVNASMFFHACAHAQRRRDRDGRCAVCVRACDCFSFYFFSFVVMLVLVAGVGQELEDVRGVAKKCKDSWPELAFEIFDVCR